MNQELDEQELHQLVSEKQRDQAALDASDATRSIGSVVPKVLAKAPGGDSGRASQWEQKEQLRLRNNRLDACRRTLGKYAGSHLDHYEVYAGAAQQKVLDRCRRIWDEIDVVIDRKLSVIFLGTLGTGKDFLAAALLQRAACNCTDCAMLSGRVFYDECSAAFANDSTQLDVYREWSRPTVLCLSDPVFESGWSPKWGEYLNRMIRMRYDAGKATWATVNATSVEHAREMFGFDVWDRLMENAVLIEMRWPSYRTRVKNTEY